jgi:hypothetical protein
MRTFLKCLDQNHAEVVDKWVLMDYTALNGGSSVAYSGVYAKAGLVRDTYAIVWDENVAKAFADSEGSPELVLIDETFYADGTSYWTLVLPPEPVEEPL